MTPVICGPRRLLYYGPHQQDRHQLLKEATMFCYQCEHAANGKACTKIGVCGKDPELSALQDLLIYSLKGLSLYAAEARKAGIVDQEINIFTAKALFSTLTNVDFDPGRFRSLILRGIELREGLKARVKAAGGRTDFTHGSVTFSA